MARKDRNPMEDVSIGDVTDEIYPSGVPKGEDGSIDEDGEIPVTQVRKAGAVDGESARNNKARARFAHRKQHGDKFVRFGAKDAKSVFDAVIKTWGSSNIQVHVTRLEPHPPVDYTVVNMASMRHSGDLQDYVQKCHRNAPPATYQVIFREGTVAERGKGLMYMPDTTADVPVPAVVKPVEVQPQAPPQQAPQWPMPPWGYPPNPYGPYSQGYPGPSPGYPGSPPGYYPPAQAPQPIPQPSSTPAVPPTNVPPSPAQDFAGYVYSAEMQKMQELLRQNQLQLQHALGAIEAMRAAAAVAPPAYLGAPPAPVPVAVAAPPPPPPIPVKPPPTAMETLQGATQQFMGMAKAIKDVQQMMSMFSPPAAVVAEEELQENPIVAPPEDNSPIITTEVMAGDKKVPLSYYRESGKLHVPMTMMGIAPVLIDGVKEALNAVTRFQDRQNQIYIQQQRMRQGIVEAPQQLSAPEPDPPPPPVAPPNTVPSASEISAAWQR